MHVRLRKSINRKARKVGAKFAKETLSVGFFYCYSPSLLHAASIQHPAPSNFPIEILYHFKNIFLFSM